MNPIDFISVSTKAMKTYESYLQLYFRKYHGKLFHLYDHASWYQVYRKTGYDHQRKNDVCG